MATTEKNITLIEPSLIGLYRAENFLKCSSPITKINKELDDIISTDIKANNIALHLFSNILDMGDSHFNMKNLADKIIHSNDKKAYFICVSPYNHEKLERFMSLFKKENSFQEISTFNGYFENEQQWKIVYKIFKIGD